MTALGYGKLLEAYDENAVRDALKEWKQFHPRTFEQTVSEICRLIAQARPQHLIFHPTGTNSACSENSITYESWV